MRQRFSYLLMLFLGLLCSASVFSQMDFVDSIKKRLDTTQVVTERIRLLLEMVHFTTDQGKVGDYAEQAIELAQESRDRRLIASTYVEIGHGFMGNSALADNVTEAMKDFQSAAEMAREKG